VWLAELWDVGLDRRCTGWRPKIVAAARPTHFDFKEKKIKPRPLLKASGSLWYLFPAKVKKKKEPTGLNISVVNFFKFSG
jgi:hypothetical protein